MKKKFMLSIVCASLFISLCGVNSFASGLELASLLVDQLGVTSHQATAGAGSIFSLAQKNLDADQFSTIAKAVTGMDSYLEAAPDTAKSSNPSLLEAGASMLGQNSSMSGLASLASSFSSLGMDSDTMGKFIPVVLDYVQEKGGEVAMSLLKTAIGM